MRFILISNTKIKYHIEFLRIIAILFVIFNHTGTKGFFLFSIREESPFYWIYLFISILCKIAVPIFYMISGALLLNIDETLKVLYKKRVLKFLATILFFSFIQYIYVTVKNHTSFSLLSFLGIVYSKNIAVAYWYLYSYLGLLVMLPFLRKMTRALNKNDYLYLIICQFVVVSVIPILQYLFTRGNYSLNSNIAMPILTSSIYYFILGYFLENILEETDYNYKRCMVLVFSSIIAIFISCFMTYYRAQITGICTEKDSQLFHSVLINIPTFTVYYCTKYFFIKTNIKDITKKIIVYFGSFTFGIMLFENILRSILEFIFYRLRSHLGDILSCGIYVMAVFLGGAIITLILKLIPGIKKLI